MRAKEREVYLPKSKGARCREGYQEKRSADANFYVMHVRDHSIKDKAEAPTFSFSKWAHVVGVAVYRTEKQCIFIPQLVKKCMRNSRRERHPY
jgi:hypothetical protein